MKSTGSISTLLDLRRRQANAKSLFQQPASRASKTTGSAGYFPRSIAWIYFPIDRPQRGLAGGYSVCCQSTARRRSVFQRTTGRAASSKARKQTNRLATRSPLVPNAQAEVYRNEEDHVLRSCLILFVLITTSTRLYSQDGLSLTPIAISVPKGNFLSNPSVLLIQELPYCELGYGPCGGQCSSDEGKKKWNCPPDALPCHHDGQRCICEVADMCKPQKKRAEPSP